MLVIGIHTLFQIIEGEFQFTDLPFNLVDYRGRGTWVGVIPSYFLADLPKFVLLSRNQIFVIHIR